jgi:MFS superfamily sulfate permease-like transporter
VARKRKSAEPTGAFVVVISGIVALHGVDGLFMCTVMAGVLLMIMGIAGMGTAVKFIPRPVVIGFTNGIAILIASTQVKDFFGLQLARVPGVFWQRMEALAGNFHTISYTATARKISVTTCSRPSAAPDRSTTRWKRLLSDSRDSALTPIRKYM